MALVPAKCTQCGASLEVDPSQEAGICKSCGTAFITEKVIKNYNTFNVDNSVNIYLGGKGDKKKDEIADAIKGLIVACDYDEDVDLYKRIKKLVDKYPGSAEVHSACGLAIGELFARCIKNDGDFGEAPDYEMYLGEVGGKDVYINISYPLGLFEKAIKFAKNETEEKQVKKYRREFSKKLSLALHDRALSSSYKARDQKPFTIDEILEKINKPMDTKVGKKKKFNFFHSFHFKYDWFFPLIAWITLVAIPAFAIVMFIPIAREWLLARWLLMAGIILFFILGIWDVIYLVKEELWDVTLSNTASEEGARYARQYNKIFTIKLTKDNFWYAAIPNSYTEYMNRLIKRINIEIKDGRLNSDDVDWDCIFESLMIAYDKKTLEDYEELKLIEARLIKHKLKTKSEKTSKSKKVEEVEE